MEARAQTLLAAGIDDSTHRFRNLAGWAESQLTSCASISPFLKDALFLGRA